ncbi:PREDICTED: receptor-type tyrosine-protein phosphatase N2 isoform X3 [Diuraphis noxia]|uniref:receptor-type tyrosine-protein phosphatase N2 isoform X3 n=1 Tax=Diuraphis noxia TaxID=143948 RepID=UPI0007639EDA|nr:PREDICTED: receptor-type tyrosine-protein phosphatase N2 isoform X3 [Diuraphis noxia]
MIGPLIKAAFITTIVICGVHCERYIGRTSEWKKRTGCLFNRNVCTQRELCFDDHAFGKCISNYDNGAEEYTYKLIMNNLLILREDMKFLYYNGYSWPHPFTQCVLQHRLKLIRYNLPPVDNSICNQYLRVPDGRQIDDGDFANFYKQPDVYVGAEDVGRGRDYYPDIDYEYRRNIINRNRLQGTPLYLPWMPGSKQQQYEEDPSALIYGQPRFRPDYNTPEGFRAGEEMKDKMDDEWKKLRQMDMLSKGIDNSNKAYTEGGLVFLPKKGWVFIGTNGEEDEVMFSDFINNYDSESGWAGFKRPERLDVKKPGPFFKLNNFVKNDEENEPKSTEDITKTVDATTLLGTNRKMNSDDNKSTNSKTSTKLTQDDFKTTYVSKITPEEEKYGQKKEKTQDKMNDTDNDNYEVVDTSYVCIRLKEKISHPDRGDKLLKTLANFINVEFKYMVNARFEESEITFQILPSAGINVTEIVRKIEIVKNKFAKKTGYTIDFVSIGDKAKTPSVMMSSTYEDSKNFEWIFMSVAAVCAVVASVAALLIIRRHSRYKNKFEGLLGSSAEVSKDYQELCRARMSNKKEEPNAASQRIASLSKDPDNSPSSRSSTSSWGEEPVLSNMDISTGHMVLAYMEDHLNNKNRLDSEWAALCAYEAEPCAVNVARKPDNAKKNRYINALPYDHARVVINEYANMNNSDYINASTITDHDPRNPAYIATQGPLAETSADFWQMVWEQGCVVIVMLTRLVENDVVLCHRYWPEEGSELYHIYEVHLVSEHIWCDDYLVRSFYLKNLKTGETRTVTQFHFLTWPDGGVPNTTKALLEFRRKVNKSFRGRSCPIVVHCSDGVSRTGSYCLLDMVLNRMAKGAKEIDIAATLEHIRDQRSGAVATKAQFQMVLAAVAEEVQAILKALPQQQTPQPLPPPPPPAQH